MATELAELAARERALIGQLRSQKGDAEADIEQQVADIERQLDELGLFQEYEQIYGRYARLALEGDQEALKRGLYLQWIASIEPLWISGIRKIPHGLQLEVAEKVRAELERRDRDPELEVMLAWYYSIWHFYFTDDLGVTFHPRSVDINDCIPVVKRGKDRGQLSDYWRDMCGCAV